MEIQCPSFQVLITFFLFLITILKIWKRSKTNLPPGPWKLPVLGNLHQLACSLPHRRLRDLANQYGPLMHLQLGEVSTIVVSSAKFAKEVMQTHDVTFASRPHILANSILTYGNTNIAFSPYGDYWRQMKKISTLELLSTKRVQSFRPIREDEVMNLINSIPLTSESPINLSERILSYTYRFTSRAAFGKETKDQETFIYIVKEAMKVAGGFDIADIYPNAKVLHQISGMRPKLEKLQKEADKIMESIIKGHQDVEKSKIHAGEAKEDMVDVLLKFHEHNSGVELPLNTDNIKALILEIFGAGGETAATTIDWAMSEMIKNPRIMKMAQDDVREVFNRKGKVDETGIEEMKYLNLVVKETLRLHPPFPLLLPRECRESCEIDGYDIPVKTKVVVNAWAINRDPSFWNDRPESFYPERFMDSSIEYKGTNFEYIPFGAGRRMCPGISFGLANVNLPLAMLLYNFDWKLPNGMKHVDLDMTEVFGISVRRKEDLQLIPIAYHPPATAKSQV